jgi:adenosylmethionine-8-amino-7-oxononanoate aminotransferase
MSDERDDFLNASISPRQQLQDIRRILERMDAKLDGKADGSYVMALEGRIRALESTGGERAVELRHRQDQIDQALATLERKLAYATGTLAAVVVVANIAVPYFLNH